MQICFIFLSFPSPFLWLYARLCFSYWILLWKPYVVFANVKRGNCDCSNKVVEKEKKKCVWWSQTHLFHLRLWGVGGDISFKGHVPLPTPKYWHSHDIFVIVLDDNYTSVADRVLLITQAILLSLMFLNAILLRTGQTKIAFDN